jgi:DNA-binding response OmpR family regulator
MANVLHIDDSIETLQYVQKCLEPAHKVQNLSSLKDAQAFNMKDVDLILLDINLPDGSGLVFLEEALRDCEDFPPTILLTAKDTSADIVYGINIGAEDYITKPLRSAELKARVDARLRHTEKNREGNLPSDLKIDWSFQKIYRLEGSLKKDLGLTPTEFRIFQFLHAHPNQPLSRFRIIQNVWRDRPHMEPKSVDGHINKLRNKLGAHSDLIQTVYTLGYVYRPLE